MTLNQELLAELVPLVAKKLAAASAEAGEYDGDHYDAWRQRQRSAENRLMDFFTERYDARFAAQGDTRQVTMAGIRSSSTRGWEGALGNWLLSAEKKVDAAPGIKRSYPVPGSIQAGMNGGLGRDEIGRPDDDGDGFNVYGSGPVPIEPREG